MYSILHFQIYILILLMGNIKCYHTTVFTISLFKQRFIQTKINKQTKQNKTVVKIHESL